MCMFVPEDGKPHSGASWLNIDLTLMAVCEDCDLARMVTVSPAWTSLLYCEIAQVIAWIVRWQCRLWCVTQPRTLARSGGRWVVGGLYALRYSTVSSVTAVPVLVTTDVKP